MIGSRARGRYIVADLQSVVHYGILAIDPAIVSGWVSALHIVPRVTKTNSRSLTEHPCHYWPGRVPVFRFLCPSIIPCKYYTCGDCPDCPRCPLLFRLTTHTQHPAYGGSPVVFVRTTSLTQTDEEKTHSTRHTSPSCSHQTLETTRFTATPQSLLQPQPSQIPSRNMDSSPIGSPVTRSSCGGGNSPVNNINPTTRSHIAWHIKSKSSTAKPACFGSKNYPGMAWGRNCKATQVSRRPSSPEAWTGKST